MSKRTARVFSRAFKLKVLRRIEAGENVCAMARELTELEIRGHNT